MINIGFTGDFCPIGRMEDLFLKGEWKKSFSGIKPFFDHNQLNIIDLECPLTDEENQIPKTGPHLKSNPDTAEIISYLNCRLAATANNHFKDYGPEGMDDTYAALTKYNIDYFGSGKNITKASKPKLISIDGIRVGLINVTDKEWTVTENESAGCNPLDPIRVYYTIKELKQKADFIIVVAHGGHEHYPLPSPRIKKWYRFFVDAGASAVISHHTHIISAYEVYNSAPIFYGLGNFCFDWNKKRNQHWNFGMLVRLKLALKQPVGFETFYIEQNNAIPGIRFVENENYNELVQKQEELNNVLMDELLLEQSFKMYIDSKKALMNTWLEPYSGKYLPGLFKKGLLPSLVGKKKRQLLSVLIQCDTHREVLLNAIIQGKKK